ncbi:MAG: tRNA (adenosine(37)-N6)-dimethylallyltransferase MiaA [Acidimicrobiia bacterium]|nr:MAG: tRNA (adenosine(37)-N6)-dimethylallyltransferase MiaA [Acidimicrobiia bacterium]
MQAYREMDIGTAKPDAETRSRFGYHLVDLVDPSEDMSVARFQQEGAAVLDGLSDEGRSAVLAGGSGLHMRALVDPLEFPPSDDGLRGELEAVPGADLVDELIAADAAAADVVDLSNLRRVIRAVEILRLTGATPSSRAARPAAIAVRDYDPTRPFIGIGVDPGETLAARIARRLDAMLDAGLLDEVEMLAPRLGRTARQAVGYRQLIPVVAGEIALVEGREQTIRATMALAKRQRTFFRRDPRIHWIPWHHDRDVRMTTAWSHIEGLWTS